MLSSENRCKENWSLISGREGVTFTYSTPQADRLLTHKSGIGSVQVDGSGHGALRGKTKIVGLIAVDLAQ